MSFIHLNLHTEYSIVDGLIRIDQLLPACIKAHMPAVAITDQSNFFGLIKFYKTAIAAGIKPIVGVDILLLNEQNPQKPFKLTLFAQNNEGYKNLRCLVSKSYIEGQKLGQPLVLKSWVKEFSTGVIALSGGKDGDVGQALLSEELEQAKNLLSEWQHIFPDRYYLELQRTGRAEEEDYNQKALALAENLQIPVVATNAVCFLNPNDFEAHEARVCINAGYVLEDRNRPRNYTAEQCLRTSEEMMDLFIDAPEAIANTVEIAKRCNVSIELGKNLLPIFPIPNETTTVEEFLEQQAKIGLKNYLQNNPELASDLEKQQLYDQRLQFELSTIKSMGFASYFLIVADFIDWARKNDVPVGPGRGSGVGSLVAYALGITGLDPIVHELFFERFLNPERISMPDFDIDFCMDGRDRVIEYVIQRYGSERVAQIITYGTMAARAAVRDVGRVLGYPYGFVDKIAKLIPFELGISLEKALHDEEQLLKRYKEEEEVKILIDLAMKLEGITRNAGKHAGGVVIAPTKLTDFVPLYCESEDSSSIVTQFDKNDVEAIGLVKFDFLGLRTLTIIDWAVKTINMKRAKNDEALLNIMDITLDDAKTYKLLQDCATTAIFQLESRGMRDVIKRLQPDCFGDIVAVGALYRPGPLQSGMVEDFINRKHGRAEATYFHSSLEPILRPTYGVILYQEQVMQVAQVLAGYSLGGADLLRRAMGKKKPEEMTKQRAIFLEGAANKGVDKHIANNIFDLMEKFAGYGFNKSHSAAYALISYQTLWLKAHYPAEFMAAVLSSDMDNTDKVVQFLDESKRLGLTIIPPDINQGEYRFSVLDDGKIAYGLGAIKGVGQAAIESIMASRTKDGEFKSLFDFCKRVDTRKVNRRVLEALICASSFDKFITTNDKADIEATQNAKNKNRANMIASLDLALKVAEQHERNKNSGQLDLFASLQSADDEQSGLLEADYVQVEPWVEEKLLQSEKSVLGFYLSGHPIVNYRDELKNFITATIGELAPETNKTVIIAGFVVAVRIFNTRTGNRLAAITLEDETGSIDITAFSDLYVTVRDLLNEGQLLVIEGEVGVDNFSGSMRVRALKIKTLEQARNDLAKGLILRLDAESIDDVKLAELAKIIDPYRGGTCNVFVSYKLKNISAKMALGSKFKVKLQNEFLCKLRQLLDNENVTVSY